MAYVSLTPHLEEFIQREVKSGRYSSPSEVMREALRLLEEHKERRRERSTEVLRQPARSEGERAEAWQQTRQARASVRYVGPEPRPSAEEEEALIYQTVDDYRREHGAGGRG